MASSHSGRRALHRTTRPTKAKRRRTTEHTTCGVTAPDDLVLEVLLRLPARSLARLRCVCRSWDAEISSRGFQQRHHDLAAAKFAFLPPVRSHGTLLQVGTWHNNTRPVEQFAAKCKDCPKVIGSKPCRGLVLVKRPCVAEGGYSVCNPTTGEILPLPLSHRPHDVIGIGFDAAAGEFKVVQVLIGPGEVGGRVLNVGDSARGWRAPASVGSMHASFDDFTGYTTLYQHVQPVFADGCLHWSFKMSDRYVDEPHGILSFSLADESFRRLPHPPFSTADVIPYDPDADHEHKDKIWNYRLDGMIRSSESGGQAHVPLGQTLAELDGRLCVVRDARRRSGDVGGLFEIWRLQDYGTGSWSLDYRVDLAPGRVAERLTKPWLVVPLMYVDAGAPGERRKLLLATTAQEAHVYDPDSGTLRTVASAVASCGGSDESIRLVLYQESLFRFVGMKNGKGEIDFVQVD